MQYGITVAGNADGAARALRAEQRGFSSIRFWDSPLVAGDVIVNAAAAAVSTQRIRIGTGVYVPWTRDPAVTACAFASLNALAPGRLELTAGTGRTARRSYGLTPQRLEDFARHMTAVRALLRGDDAQVVAEGRTSTVRLLHPGRVLNTADPVAISIAAAGPRIRALTAELGVGWADILPPGPGGVPDSLTAMKQAWSDAGRAPEELRATYFVAHGGTLREGEELDSPRIRAIAGQMAMSEVHYWADEAYLLGKGVPDFLGPAMRAAVEGYRPILESMQGSANPVLDLQEGHCLYVRPEEAHLITPELLASGSCIWTAEGLRARMADLEAAGVAEVCFSIRPDSDEDIDDLADALRLGQV
ncbi:LLM class flavin-dependent oxidoreductase [Longivirga aurantiaca]|uniref:LLM class flavin-dependent oxidoreductase n=1 Tax=Longivirga aurantiaca TaxID=1837743 RepID=A0ABW1SX56_9ACTN